jgi:acetoin utilization deacetylase AcuC-like enzyme
MMQIFHSEKHRGHAFGLPDERPENYDSNYENPGRVDAILQALKTQPWAEILPPRDFGLEPILQVHTPAYLDYLEDAHRDWKDLSPQPGVAYVPYKAGFDPQAVRFDTIPDQDGFFMTDMYVPFNEHTFPAALASAWCALSAAQSVVSSNAVAFGLCRPPGHHSGVEVCGGFCYLNNAAIAARWLSRLGRVAILDIDYHAGNGTQSIFYDRPEVLTLSLHADPAWEYPSYAGFAHETGAGAGKGFHHNFPLPHRTDDVLYLQTLEQALELIRQYSPACLVVSAGFDTYQGDPLGDFEITRSGFSKIGQRISSLQLPSVLLLEGGYKTDELGYNVVSFLEPFVS